MKIMRVPGKTILTGEHAVVYGKLALAASISIGVRVRVVESAASKKTELVRKAIEVAGGSEQIQVKISSELPTGSGLGSSAAVSAAIIRTIREYLGNPINDDELFELTMECEKVAHGNPSGIDAAVVVYGGLIGFVKGKPIERLKVTQPVKLLLVDSGKPSETTKEMVELVANNPDKDELITKIGEISEQVKEQLLRGDEIRELLDRNGLLLEKLGVVGERAKELSRQLRAMGASVKITGAGGVKTGSGMVIVLASDFTKIKKMLDNKKIDFFETEIGKL